MEYKKKNLFSFCITPTFSYLLPLVKILSLDNKNKNNFMFCIVLTFSYLCGIKFVKTNKEYD